MKGRCLCMCYQTVLHSVSEIPLVGVEEKSVVWIGLEQLLEIQSLHDVSTDDEAIRGFARKYVWMHA
jgi:hypothetical protein